MIQFARVRSWRRGRDSNPRSRLNGITVFKTVAIDYSATPPLITVGRAGGTRTPNRRFWRPLLYQLSYRPIAPPHVYPDRAKTKTGGGVRPPRSSLPRRPTQAMTSLTRPAPIVRPPSRIAKRCPFSIATGAIRSMSTETLSPGMTISTPSGNRTVPVTSVVRK